VVPYPIPLHDGNEQSIVASPSFFATSGSQRDTKLRYFAKCRNPSFGNSIQEALKRGKHLKATGTNKRIILKRES